MMNSQDANFCLKCYLFFLSAYADSVRCNECLVMSEENSESLITAI